MWSNILPIFAIILTGSFLRSLGFCNERFFKALAHFAVNYCAPALILLSVGTSFWEPVINWPFVGVVGITVVAVLMVFTYILSVTMEKSLSRAIVGASAITFIRATLLGLPFCYGLFGRKSAVVIALALFLIYLIQALVVFVIELMGHKNGGERAFKAAFKAFFSRPVIVAAIVGYLYSFTAFEVPVGVMTYLHFFEIALIPTGLFAFGASLQFADFSHNLVKEFWPLVFKLVILPALILWVGMAFGLQPMYLVIAVLFTALPPCMGAVKMVGESGSSLDGRIKRIFGIASACSLVTLFFWCLILAEIYPNLFRFVSIVYG